MRAAMQRLGTLTLIVGLVATSPSLSAAQQRGTTASPTQRLQGTRNMHVACVGPDSGRTFTRGIGDSSSARGRSTMQTVSDTNRIKGGTPRSHEYPDYDVVLDVPNLCVERIFLKVDSVTAHLDLNAKVANLVHVTAGADVLIGNVDLTIQDVRARALLLVDLDDVTHIVDQTLTFIDNHPEVVNQLASTLANTGAAAGQLVGDVLNGVEGLLLSTTKLTNGNVLQHLVDQTTGALVDRTLSTAGNVLSDKTVGSILKLPTLKETTNTAGQVVRQVKDQAGNLIQYTLDKATNKLLGVQLLK